MLEISIISINALALYLFWAHIFNNLKDQCIDDITVCDFIIIFLVFFYDIGFILDSLGVLNLL